MNTSAASVFAYLESQLLTRNSPSWLTRRTLVQQRSGQSVSIRHVAVIGRVRSVVAPGGRHSPRFLGDRQSSSMSSLSSALRPDATIASTSRSSAEPVVEAVPYSACHSPRKSRWFPLTVLIIEVLRLSMAQRIPVEREATSKLPAAKVNCGRLEHRSDQETVNNILTVRAGNLHKLHALSGLAHCPR